MTLDGEISNNYTPAKRTKDVPIHISTPYPNFNAIKQVKPQSANPKTPIGLDRQKLIVAIRNTNPTRTPQTPPVRIDRRIVSPMMKISPMTNENAIQAKGKIEASEATPKDKLAIIKSPLKQINNHVASPNVPRTPINIARKPLKGSTSKKSLLKRLMASATPAKTHSPRKITNSTHSNNITLTSYQDPQECIDRLVHTLSGRGVECKQKEYVSKSKPWSRLTFLVRKKPVERKFDTL